MVSVVAGCIVLAMSPAAKIKGGKAKAKSVAGKKKATSPTATKAGKRVAPIAVTEYPELFLPLSAGESADALRTLTEDSRVATMAKVGRYRVICTEPLVVKHQNRLAGHRLARVVVYDYAADRCIDACVDLDAGVVAHLDINRSQPMLSREEEALAISIATADDEVRSTLTLGEQPQLATHYWGKDASEIAYSHRSAAVLFGRAGEHPAMVVVVDLLDNQVTNIVPANRW
jgi:hypothetical protein